MQQAESCIRGHHIYKRIWNSTGGEELNCVQSISICVHGHMSGPASSLTCVCAKRIVRMSILLAKLNLAGVLLYRQTAKLKSSPHFSRYTVDNSIYGILNLCFSV